MMLAFTVDQLEQMKFAIQAGQSITTADGRILQGKEALDYYVSQIPESGGSMATIYRLALHLADGSWGTGATYPGCSSAHGTAVYQAGSACDPQAFQTYDQVVAYARSRGETVRIVSSEAEAWSIADAEERKRGVAVPVTSTGLPAGAGETTILGMSLGTVAIVAISAYFLLKK